MVRYRSTLPTQPGSSYYAGNRAPLSPSPLVKLPLGQVRADGWLLGQLRGEADGFVGHLTELSRWCRLDGSAWVSPTGQGKFGWEELPYWLKGFYDLGVLLDDQRILAEAQRWLDGVLGSQRADGWFGPVANLDSNDIWPNMIMLYALRSFHEATGDERVIPLMTRYFRFLQGLPEGRLYEQIQGHGWWQGIRAGDNLDSIYWLYNRTGEAWLLDLARTNHERGGRWDEGIISWHGVNLCQGFREPAQWWQQSRETSDLAAASRNYDEARAKYGQVPGGLFGADENARPGYTGPRQAAETCSMVEFMHSAELLLRLTGDVGWADRCEDVAFNSLPASMSPDLRGLHYLTAPNMVELTRQSKAPLLQNGGDMLSYNPHQYRCCQHNVAFGWPYFVESLVGGTADDGLAVMLYAPCHATAKVSGGQPVELRVETDYPFGEVVNVVVQTRSPVEFPLYLRVPGWCRYPRVELNGETTRLTGEHGPWIEVRRTWAKGDRVALDLPMELGVRVWEQNHGSVSIDRGPLTYSLKLGEEWSPYGDEPWPGYEVHPTAPWNYGLELDPMHPGTSVHVASQQSVSDQPFAADHAPVTLTATARKIPVWHAEPNGLVGAVQDSPAYSAEPVETITLIPMGCARLRIASFPTVSTDPTAHRWLEPPEPPTASHCNPADTTLALCDGLEPRNSNDHRIPRFTWWNHRGTTEWVQYTFDEPRSVTGCEVYWFDDTGVGQCRVPARWRVLYLDGETWRDVTGATTYGTAQDQYNRVDFTPVTTTAVRLEAALQPSYSGGILEWRVNPKEQP